MNRKPPHEAAVRDIAMLRRWLNGEPGITARDAMFTCAECHHANRAFPKATLAFGRPASKFCPIRGNVIHGRNRACSQFVLRADLTCVFIPDHE
jgi:hypothetical protein